MTHTYRIGSFYFSLEAPPELSIPDNFRKFEGAIGPSAYHYHLELTDQLPEPSGKLIFQRPDIGIFQAGNLQERLIRVRGEMEPYALYREEGSDRARIYFDRRF